MKFESSACEMLLMPLEFLCDYCKSHMDVEIVCMYFGIGCKCNYSLESIGEKYNLSRERTFFFHGQKALAVIARTLDPNNYERT